MQILRLSKAVCFSFVELIRCYRLILLLIPALVYPTFSVAQVFSVHGVQYPVWVERAGAKVALGPGNSLLQGDVLMTGEGGKAWLNMEDGARVKLGENAAFQVNQVASSGVTESAEAGSSALTEASTETSTIEGSFGVLEGAFRYTTGVIERLSKRPWKRSLDIQLGSTTTVGIRGTDLWGRVDAAEQFVVLLEGVISVTSATSGKSASLENPLEIYKASNEQVSTVAMADVQALAPETELDFGDGVQVDGGQYQLHLASFPSQRGAQALQQKLSAAGVYADISSAQVNGKQWFRVSLQRVQTLKGANTLAKRLAQEFGLSAAWVANQ